MKRQDATRRKAERGFTLTEMLMATVVVIFGLVAVAQLVPTSVILNSNNRNDGTALVFAQRQMEVLRTQPLSALSFTDPPGGMACPSGQICGVSCPIGQTCLLGNPAQPGQTIGCPVVMFNGSPVINFSVPAASECAPNYYFTYTDPNDPFGATYDVRWDIVTNINPATQVVTSRRIILGVFRLGMQTPTLPVTLDVQVEK
jgi:type II secretory pathway pseudopilin PulG